MFFLRKNKRLSFLLLVFFGYTWLHSADFFEDGMIQQVVEGEQNTPCFILLSHAHHDENLEKIKSMVELGVDVNIQNGSGQTALMMAARYGCEKIVTYLLDSGADVNLRDGYRNSALDYAIRGDRVEVARYLIDCKAQVSPSVEGEKPLWWKAALRKQWSLAKYLIEHGARVVWMDNLLFKTKTTSIYERDRFPNAFYNYLARIVIAQKELKYPLAGQQITQEPDFAQYASNRFQHNRQLPEKRSRSEDEIREQMREEEKYRERTDEEKESIEDDQRFANMIESFMADHSAYWRGKFQDVYFQWVENDDCQPLKKFLTEISPGLLPLIADSFKKREVFQERIMNLLKLERNPEKTLIEDMVYEFQEAEIEEFLRLKTKLEDDPRLSASQYRLSESQCRSVMPDDWYEDLYASNVELVKQERKDFCTRIGQENISPEIIKQQQLRLEQILGAEQRAMAERYAPDAGPVFREALAQKIKKEMEAKQQEQHSGVRAIE